jgi:hypothetical protein
MTKPKINKPKSATRERRAVVEAAKQWYRTLDHRLSIEAATILRGRLESAVLALLVAEHQIIPCTNPNCRTNKQTVNASTCKFCQKQWTALEKANISSCQPAG